MLSYVLICLCLALTGVAGLQMMYMIYLESIDRERKKHVTNLERECKHLRADLAAAEAKISEQSALIESAAGEEAWADVIEER